MSYKKNEPIKKALIVGNGPLPSKKFIEKLLEEYPWIICADGGANRLLRRGLLPQVIVGDLDSLAAETKQALAAVELVHIADQESTDLEKALDYALAHGFTCAVVIGATGRRVDHTLANFSILGKYHHKLDLHLVDHYCEVRIVEQTVELDVEPGTILSLLPLGRCEGITTHGLYYALKDESLELGIREGVSNMVTRSPVKIEIRAGKLLLFIVHKP